MVLSGPSRGSVSRLTWVCQDAIIMNNNHSIITYLMRHNTKVSNLILITSSMSLHGGFHGVPDNVGGPLILLEGSGTLGIAPKTRAHERVAFFFFFSSHL